MAKRQHMVEASEIVQTYFETEDRLQRLAANLGVGVLDEAPLGCGAWGCAYRVVDSPLVVKITMDEDEAPTWRVLQEMRLPGVPHVKEVVELTTPPGTMYAIVREGVDPLPVELHFGGADEDSIALHEWLDVYRTDARNFYYYHDDAGRLEQVTDHLLTAAAELQEIPRARDLGVTLAALAEAGYPPVDLHDGNIGIRVHEQFGMVGQILFIDPGVTPAEGAPAIERRMAANRGKVENNMERNTRRSSKTAGARFRHIDEDAPRGSGGHLAQQQWEWQWRDGGGNQANASSYEEALALATAMGASRPMPREYGGGFTKELVVLPDTLRPSPQRTDAELDRYYAENGALPPRPRGWTAAEWKKHNTERRTSTDRDGKPHWEWRWTSGGHNGAFASSREEALAIAEELGAPKSMMPYSRGQTIGLAVDLGTLRESPARTGAQWDRYYAGGPDQYTGNPAPPPPPPRRGHADTQRRMARIVEEQERPFDPEREYERETRGHHFAVNESVRGSRPREEIAELLAAATPEQVSLICDLTGSGGDTTHNEARYTLNMIAARMEGYLLTLRMRAGAAAAWCFLLKTFSSGVEGFIKRSFKDPDAIATAVVYNQLDERWEFVQLPDFITWFEGHHCVGLTVVEGLH